LQLLSRVLYKLNPHVALEISAKIREKHNDAMGVPIKKEMHQLFHEMYGKKNTRPENLLEFKLLYLRGKLDDIKKSS
jgi:hypothetical protein